VSALEPDPAQVLPRSRAQVPPERELDGADSHEGRRSDVDRGEVLADVLIDERDRAAQRGRRTLRTPRTRRAGGHVVRDGRRGDVRTDDALVRDYAAAHYPPSVLQQPEGLPAGTGHLDGSSRDHGQDLPGLPPGIACVQPCLSDPAYKFERLVLLSWARFDRYTPRLQS
jgi:hypothetical protein